MDFRTYFLSIPTAERAAFAARCGTSLRFLTNVAYGRKPGEKLCIAIERESGGKVRCEVLRDDVDWGYLRGTAPVPQSQRVAA